MDKPIPKEIEDRITWAKLDEGNRRIKSIKPVSWVCDACDRVCKNPRRISVNICKDTMATHAHQKFKCSECKLYRDPATGEFTLEYHQISDHFRKSKHKRR